MRKVIMLTILLCAFPVIALGDDNLNLHIITATGERGRDSSSTTRSITISGDALVYKVTYGGRNRGRRPEQNKEFKLESADRKRLIELIKTHKLLITKTVEPTIAETGTSFYFYLSISSEVNGKKGMISIRGPREAPDIKESDLYKNSIALITAVYEIIHRTDKEIVFERPIH